MLLKALCKSLLSIVWFSVTAEVWTLHRGRILIFHHFRIRRCLVVYKCRRSSDLGFARGSLGSLCSTTELRPLVVSDCTQELICRTAALPFLPAALMIGSVSHSAETGFLIPP